MAHGMTRKLPLNLIAILLFFGSIVVFLLFLNSRLSRLISQLTEENTERSQSRSLEFKGLQREVERLRVELTAFKRSVDRKQQFEQPRRVDPLFPLVKERNEAGRKRILVTGGAGFLGSHLVERLMRDGHEVIALDNFFTGRKRNVEEWIGHPNFELVHHDVVNPFYSEVDQIYHLASPASPPHYMYNPVKTLKTNILGTINMLGLARRVKARLLFASSSEVYGDPKESPQSEAYFGHVNPIGPRSCYDEGKRAGESLLMAFHKQERVDVRIARIFNTFGPRMHINDGRVVSNLITQALMRQPMTVYGDGEQTRSFQYVSDLIDGLIALMNAENDGNDNGTSSTGMITMPVNLGNPEEYGILEFARIIRNLTASPSEIVHTPRVEDDPQQRRPDIRRAAELLGWRPKVSMLEGLERTIGYFRRELEHEKPVEAD